MYRFLPIALFWLAACGDMDLPDLKMPVGDGVSFGADYSDRPVLGITVVDPLNRMR